MSTTTKKIALTLFAASLSALGSSNAHAAPSMELTQLPISSQMEEQLENEGFSKEYIADFVNLLGRINVYDDHTNPEPEFRDDRNKKKTFWIAPFFQASNERAAVGAEMYSDRALTIVDSIDQALSAVSLEARDFMRIQKELRETKAAIQRLEDLIANTVDPAEGEIEQLNDTLAVKRTQLETLKQEMRERSEAGTNKTKRFDDDLRQSLITDFLLQCSRLGITKTRTEENLLLSDDPNDWTTALMSIRQRVGWGQFGLKQIVMESSFSPRQKELLKKYLQMRQKDVVLKGLQVKSVFAVPTGQTVFTAGGKSETRSGAMMLRGVNLGSQGKCGNTRSCNVIVEYTDLGARAASSAAKFTSGIRATLVPVAFEADVTVKQPDFVGSVECKFTTGWRAHGRADVKDGAVVYDGDLTNKIKFESLTSPGGGCKMNVIEGDQNSAHYHAIKDMHKYYTDMFAQRVQASKRDKDRYERRIRDELQRHQRASQVKKRRRGGWFSDVLNFATGGLFGRISSFIVGQSRDFYWHTTKLNTESTDKIDFTHSYNVRNLVATQRFTFDGFPLVCREALENGAGTQLVACDDIVTPEVVDTEAGSGEDTCTAYDFFGDCID